MANITVNSPIGYTWESGTLLVFDVEVDTSGYMFIDFDNSLELWWRMDNDASKGEFVEQSGVYDWSGKGHNAGWDGGYNNINAKFGNGCIYHSGTYVGVSTDSYKGTHYDFYLPQNRGITISTWMKTNSVGATHQDLFQVSSLTRGYRSYIHAGGETAVHWGDPHYVDLTVSDLSPANFPMNDNQWHHYAAVITDDNPTKIIQYHDGILVSVSSGTYTKSEMTYLGFSSVYYYSPSGWSDDSLIFTRVLPSSEIYALYLASSEKKLITSFDVGDKETHQYTIHHVDYNGVLTSTTPAKILINNPTSLPRSTLLYPTNGSATSKRKINFRFLAESTNSGVLLSSGVIDLVGNGYSNNTVVSLSGIRQEVSQFITVPSNQSGIIWSASAIDNGGRTGNSGSGTFTIGQTEFHVATTGNDSNSGTSSSPFATIQKFCNIAEPGYKCIIHGGDYRESIIMSIAGTERQPITIKGATNEVATINGCELLTGWTLASGDHIYKASFITPSGRGMDSLFCDGDGWTTYEARYPALVSNYLDDYNDIVNLDISGGSSYTSTQAFIKCGNLTQPSGYWENATMYGIWGQRYHALTALVTNYNSGTQMLTCAFDTVNAAIGTDINSYGIFALLGTPNCICSSGQWAMNYSTNEMYLWTLQGDDPDNHTVEVKQRHTGLKITSSYVNVENLRVFGCNVHLDRWSHHCKLDGLTCLYPTRRTKLFNSWIQTGNDGLIDTGVIIDGHHHLLKNSTIKYSSHNGTSLIGHHNIVDNCIVNYANWMTTSGSNVCFGQLGCYNVVKNCELGYSGRELMVMSYTKRNLISHNKFHHAVSPAWAWDHGSFYTQATENCCVLEYNHFYDSRSAYPIYLDGPSYDMLIHHNLVELYLGDTEPAWHLSILVNEGHHNIKLHHNTCLGNVYLDRNSGAYVGTKTYGVEVYNNICRKIYTRNGSDDVPMSASEGTESNNLEFNGWAATQFNSIFVSSGNHNFMLASGSPAIGSGIYLGYTVDMSGNTILNPPSVGCYEYI